MYVHIGKDVVVKTENIIGIFDIEKLEKKNSLENVCKNINISDKIIDVSEKNKCQRACKDEPAILYC